MRRLIHVLILLCFVSLLIACGERKEEGIKPVEKKMPMKNITSKPQNVFQSISAKVANLPKFDFYAIKDPFYSPIVQQSVKMTKAAKVTKSSKPMEKFELEKYKLLGVVVERKTRAAIFEDPDGKGWVLKEGMNIGNEGFRIKKITSDGVLLEGLVESAEGKKKVTEVFISIKKLQ